MFYGCCGQHLRKTTGRRGGLKDKSFHLYTKKKINKKIKYIRRDKQQMQPGQQTAIFQQISGCFLASQHDSLPLGGRRRAWAGLDPFTASVNESHFTLQLSINIA